MSDSKLSHHNIVAGQSATRDPRLLNKINTTNSIATGHNSSASVAKSPNIPASAFYKSNDGNNELARSPAISTTGQVLPVSQRPPSPSPSRTPVEQQDDPATLFVTLLSSLLENASSSAALKYEQSKIKTKAAYQASLDKKMGDLSKTFPAFAETSVKAKKEIDRDLTALDEKLSEHQKAQAGFLAAVPDILRASNTPTITKKEQEHIELVQRCMSLDEKFKFNVEDLKQRLEKQKSVTSNLEKGHVKMDSKIQSAAEQVRNLTSQLKSVQGRCSDLDKKHNDLKNASQSSSAVTRRSLAEMKTDIKHCTEHHERQQTAIDRTTNTIDQMSQRLGLLESQHQTFSEAKTLHAKQIEELGKLTGHYLLEIEKIKSMASSDGHASESDTLTMMRREIQELRQPLSEVQNKEFPASLNTQELSALRKDTAALKEELEKLRKDEPALQVTTELGQKLHSSDMRGNAHNAEDGSAGTKGQSHLADLEDRLKACLTEIEGIQGTLVEKRTEEDTRDDLISAQMEEMKDLILKAKEEIGHRIESVEADIKKRRGEDLHMTQRLQDSVTELLKAGNQVSTPRISPPSAPPTPQMHLPQMQGASISPQPMLQVLPAEMNKRLEGLESLQKATRQQLQAVSLGYQQLDRRYNNLSTEPIVRAMVHQMQMMYPYASEAQREIVNLKHMIDPLRNILPQLERLTAVVNNHTAAFATISNFGARIDALERERSKHDAKQEKLVEHVKQEREKLIDEVNNQKATADGIAKRLDVLENHRKAEPDKLEYPVEKLANKLRTEFTEPVENIMKRLDSLESDSRRQAVFDSKRQDLLQAFTEKPLASKTADYMREVQDEDTDDSSIPLSVKTNGLESDAPPLSAELGKTFLKIKTVSNAKKRKRYGSQENNDRSDDDTYVPEVRSSPARRKLRGSQ